MLPWYFISRQSTRGLTLITDPDKPDIYFRLTYGGGKTTSSRDLRNLEPNWPKRAEFSRDKWVHSWYWFRGDLLLFKSCPNSRCQCCADRDRIWSRIRPLWRYLQRSGPREEENGIDGKRGGYPWVTTKQELSSSAEAVCWETQDYSQGF